MFHCSSFYVFVITIIILVTIGDLCKVIWRTKIEHSFSRIPVAQSTLFEDGGTQEKPKN